MHRALQIFDYLENVDQAANQSGYFFLDQKVVSTLLTSPFPLSLIAVRSYSY